MNQNLKKAKAIEYQNKRKLIAVNPYLDEQSGIYFLTRTDENGIKYAYIGQAKHLLTRLAQHLSGYQHIDLSLRKYGLYATDNLYGWKVGFKRFPENVLDEMERHWIKQYALAGYQMRNKDTGGGKGKQEVGERKESKGYYDGILQGKKMLARELSHIIDKHLTITLKEEKVNNKVSIGAFKKFKDLLNEENYQKGE